MSVTTVCIIWQSINLIIAILYYFGIYKPNKEILNGHEEREKRHNETYLTKTGSTSLYFPPTWSKIRDGKSFNYHLRSFDGGKNWFAIDREKLFDEVFVIGLVEHVYPGLMDYLERMDNLTNHVYEHGSLDITDSEDIKILNDAGFTVSQKSK